MINQNIRYIEVRKPAFNADKPCFEAWTVCPFCDKYHKGFTITDVPSYMEAFRNSQDMLIQEAFSEEVIQSCMIEYTCPEDVREFHQTGVCNDCWSEMTRFEEFGDEFADEEFTEEELFEVTNG